MSAISILWLGLGLGVGWVAGQWLHRRPAPSARLNPGFAASPTAPVSPEPPPPDDQTAALRQQLHQTELAYYMAIQLCQLKGGFLARTSHELRSPLNGVIGMNQLILAELTDSPEEEREFIAQANEAALKMVRVLDDVIDVAKLEQGSQQLAIQPVQVLNLFQGVQSLTHLQAQNRNLPLTIADPHPDWYVVADPKRLRQVLVMLLDTAIAHTDEGSLSLTVQWSPDAETCQIVVSVPVAATLWSEENLPSPGKWRDPQGFALDKTAIVRLANQPFPHPGFTFAIARSLMQSMDGDIHLTVVASAPHATHIHCTIPRIQPDTSI